ncbi:MAG: DUF134 domain-containing protein [Bacillota bacterium]
MPRPTKPRWVEFTPTVTYFKPAGIRMRELEEVSLGIDEVEALRLKDLTGLEQEDCAKRMNLAQSTFQRVLTAARTKVSRALIEGKALRIEGGNYLVSPSVFTCRDCGLEWPNQRRGPQQDLQCPSCGSRKVDESRGAPCGEKPDPDDYC